jgi:hypothetical protein
MGRNAIFLEFALNPREENVAYIKTGKIPHSELIFVFSGHQF